MNPKLAEESMENRGVMNVSDNWKHRSERMTCKTCMWFVPKVTRTSTGSLGRCRRHAPSINGFVPVFETDWCGDHRIDENKINDLVGPELDNGQITRTI